MYVGLYIKGDVKTKELHLVGDRQRVRDHAVIRSLEWLRRELIKKGIK